VAFHDEFEGEFDRFPEAARNSILVRAKLLEKVGPHLKRPHADTLNGSKYPNMKELRCGAANEGEWPSHSIPGGEQFFLLPEIRPVPTRSASTRR